MGISFRGAEYVTGASVVDLTTVLGLSEDTFVSHVIVRAGSANAGFIFVGGPTLTDSANRYAYLDATESLTIAVETGSVKSNQIYFVADTPTDVIHVLVLA